MPERNAGTRWTADDIPDLTGKVAIVTGANSGIGFEAARELARKGAATVLACRSVERGQRALDALQSEVPAADAVLMELDLASLDSIGRFADAFRERHERLDLLINNAGIMAVPYARTADGFESQLGVNHLGHFALTGQIIDLIAATPAARVVNVSSLAHRNVSMDFGNLLYENGGYSPMRAYGRSKLANLLFTHELQRRFKAAGVDALALAAHPGFSETGLAVHLRRGWQAPVMLLISLLSQSAARGALPTLRAAAVSDARGGQFYGPHGIMGIRGFPVAVEPSAVARDDDAARRLWEASERLTGVSYARLEPARDG